MYEVYHSGLYDLIRREITYRLLSDSDGIAMLISGMGF